MVESGFLSCVATVAPSTPEPPPAALSVYAGGRAEAGPRVAGRPEPLARLEARLAGASSPRGGKDS